MTQNWEVRPVPKALCDMIISLCDYDRQAQFFLINGHYYCRNNDGSLVLVSKMAQEAIKSLNTGKAFNTGKGIQVMSTDTHLIYFDHHVNGMRWYAYWTRKGKLTYSQDRATITTSCDLANLRIAEARQKFAEFDWKLEH